MDISTGIFTLLGAIVGGGASYLATSNAGKQQFRIQQARFDREARAHRLSTIVAIRDLVQYAHAAVTQAHFNVDLWRPSVDTLLRRVTDPETVYGFTNEEWTVVSAVASEARLGVVRLEQLNENPFRVNLDRSNDDVFESQLHYIGTIREVGNHTMKKINAALHTVGDNEVEFEMPMLTDLIDSFRRRLGQQPVIETAMSPSQPFQHR